MFVDIAEAIKLQGLLDELGGKTFEVRGIRWF